MKYRLIQKITIFEVHFFSTTKQTSQVQFGGIFWLRAHPAVGHCRLYTRCTVVDKCVRIALVRVRSWSGLEFRFFFKFPLSFIVSIWFYVIFAYRKKMKVCSWNFCLFSLTQLGVDKNRPAERFFEQYHQTAIAALRQWTVPVEAALSASFTFPWYPLTTQEPEWS